MYKFAFWQIVMAFLTMLVIESNRIGANSRSEELMGLVALFVIYNALGV